MLTTTALMMLALFGSAVGLPLGLYLGSLFLDRIPTSTSRPVPVRLQADVTEYQEAMKKALGDG